ncbi:DUF1837 domain-containing protein [Flavobacterium sp. MMLR14_040]|uniref:HamA C-terminal domain-containing protein n=1 Tax=Flavobacterium sp. MMLR14_040 TaxID=3093843 RepID=UPI00298FC094|nr:DUF1837 domain-containing protein [Flavobacterium sp. MMLR14_040]MDW8853103.1 DUF1837 domain-containing protein [Flavobacterium sp. MMLR14_040]
MKFLTKRVENLFFKFSLVLEKGKWSHIPLHLNYEDGKYRQNEIKNIINDTLPHFALTPSEFAEYSASGDDGEKYRRSWSRISKRDKSSKGDYGELLLFLILKVFFKSDKLVTKVKLKTGNQEVYGYDCAHFTIENNEPILWLGESKFYDNFSGAIANAFESLESHCCTEFTKNEFSFLEPHIEINKDYQYSDIIREKLSSMETFDNIKIKVPVFITYDCKKIKNHQDATTQEFLEDFQEEFFNKSVSIEKKSLDLKSNFELLFILLPLESVKDLKEQIDKLEQSNR